jgi:hypothetical protein
MRGYVLITTLLLTLVTASLSWAGKDEEIFIQKCGNCHQTGGEATPVNPASKAGLVWKKYFKRNRHPINLSLEISADEMISILEYLQDHAADSDHPVAAAIPK